jgi:hypothetical protein
MDAGYCASRGGADRCWACCLVSCAAVVDECLQGGLNEGSQLTVRIGGFTNWGRWTALYRALLSGGHRFSGLPGGWRCTRQKLGVYNPFLCKTYPEPTDFCAEP